MQKSILISLLGWAALGFAQGACSVDTGVVYTFYGYADNTPPGANLAYSCASGVSGSTPVASGVSGAPVASPSSTTKKGSKGNKSWNGRRGNFRRGAASPQAHGTGTYEDPLTMAGATKYFSQCEVVYSPYLQKYLRYEDTCTGCEDSASQGILHVDIWTGPTTSNAGSALLKCENSLTPSGTHTLVRSPPANLPVTGKLHHVVSELCTNHLTAEELYTAGSCNTNLLQTVLTTTTFC
jgi:hypothetical protein